MEKRKINRFCEVAALVLALAALLTLIGTGLTERVHLGTWGGKTEAVAFLPILPVQGAALLLGGMLAALALFALLKRHARLGWALAALWGAAAAILAVGFGTKQVYDAAIVQEAAELFARGNYKMMSADYLNAYPYQLGICLPMEILLRLFPGLHLNLTMQLVNVAMALGAAAAMAALGRTIFEDSRISRACEAAGLLVWPALLFCQQVYGTIPMLFFVSLAMLCYAKYVKTRRRALGAAFACLLALAYAAKINAAVALIAVTICSVLDALENRKLEPLAYAALAIALSLLLLRAIIWQYERRSGVTLNSGIGALARLTMGMQEGGGGFLDLGDRHAAESGRAAGDGGRQPVCAGLLRRAERGLFTGLHLSTGALSAATRAGEAPFGSGAWTAGFCGAMSQCGAGHCRRGRAGGAGTGDI